MILSRKARWQKILEQEEKNSKREKAAGETLGLLFWKVGWYHLWLLVGGMDVSPMIDTLSVLSSIGANLTLSVVAITEATTKEEVVWDPLTSPYDQSSTSA